MSKQAKAFSFAGQNVGGHKAVPQAIKDLPDSTTRNQALQAATDFLEKKLKMLTFKDIGPMEPIYTAFGMSESQAREHPMSAVLLTVGNRIPLKFLPNFNAKPYR